MGFVDGMCSLNVVVFVVMYVFKDVIKSVVIIVIFKC